MEIICIKRYLITNHHIPQVENQPQRFPHHRKTLKSLYSEHTLKKESVISVCINWLRKRVPYRWGQILFVLFTLLQKENTSAVPKLRDLHLQWGPKVPSPLQFLSWCWSRNMMVQPPALKYILQTPRVYSYTNNLFLCWNTEVSEMSELWQ